MSAKTTATFIIVSLLALVAVLVFVQPPNPVNPVKPEYFNIYFVKQRGGEVVAEPTQRALLDAPLDAVQPEYRLRYVMLKLIEGPTAQERDAGYFSEIPPKTELKGVASDGKSFSVNVSKAFMMGGGSNSMQMRLLEVQKTLCGVSNITYPIHLLIGGDYHEVIGGEGVPVDDPLCGPKK